MPPGTRREKLILVHMELWGCTCGVRFARVGDAQAHMIEMHPQPKRKKSYKPKPRKQKVTRAEAKAALEVYAPRRS